MGRSADLGICVKTSSANRHGFQMHLEKYEGADIKFAKIGYLAYSTEQTKNIHADTYISDVHWGQCDPKPSGPIVPTCSEPAFIPFPEGKFQTTPTVLVALREFRFERSRNVRLKQIHEVTKEGVFIHGFTWWDSRIKRLSYEIIAIE